MELVGAFARHATLALELATVQDQRLRLAVYEERDRIARDLHDVVIQRLFGAGLTVQSMLPRLPDALRDGGERLVDELDEAVRELRTAIFALHRPDADGAGLRGRLHDLVRTVSAQLGHRPRLRLVGPLDALVDEHLADHVLAVVGEALTNVARHARAGATSVHVTADAGELVVEVTDDGVGLPDVVDAAGEGLRNLASRAAELGGTCTVGRRAGGGTRVEWRVPLAP
ncbi:sensor histidine kinase [Actinotalea solisilvae]|uniref:sensor histidine kinase n=1 Tax=Actinotalea solisilvae TaxID=2072922 RepID=UPI0018F1A236|nr:sensor histidine kinase [Actinotalea solisilvae]